MTNNVRISAPQVSDQPHLELHRYLYAKWETNYGLLNSDGRSNLYFILRKAHREQGIVVEVSASR